MTAQPSPALADRRPGPTVRTRVHELTADASREHEDRLAAEEPLEIRMTWPGHPASRAWVTMRTPGHDFELAVGWVVHEGIAPPDAIGTVVYCTDRDLPPEHEFNVVTVTLTRAPTHDPGHRHQTQASGAAACGVCGKDSVSDALAVVRGPRWAGPELPAEMARALPDRLREHQPLFARTGAVHGAGLATVTGELLVVREDIGRHNAVDKVTGARTLHGDATTEAALVISGRAGFELVQKAVAAGVGALVAVGAPSALAVRLAREAGLGLYGFTSAQRCVRYS